MPLSVENISKLYNGKIWGLKNFSLEIKPGIVGLLGPNGAGKSSLMRILATITKPTEGKIIWNGINISKNPNIIRSVLGYLPQDFGIYPNLNSFEFLEYMAAVKGINYKEARKRIGELLTVLNLNDYKKQLLGSYSGGMKQRVGIAQALLNDPQLLIIDEPTAGLDPEERINFRNILSDLSGERIVILSTHIVSDVEASATSIAIINKGRLITHASPEELLTLATGKVWDFSVPGEDLPKIKEKYIVSSAIHNRNTVHTRIISSSSPSIDARPVMPNLEDSYLYLLSSYRESEIK